MDNSKGNFHRFFLYLLMSTWCIVNCVISEAQICKRTDSIQGHRLNGHVILRHKEPDIWSCFQTCKINERCQSINYDLNTNLCELSNRTKIGRQLKFLPKEGSVYFDNPFRGHLGKTRALPGLSCKDINDSEDNVTTGEYWISPEPSKDPITVFCDMTTDGGGWTLIANTVIRKLTSRVPRMTAARRYRMISNHTSGYIRIDVPAIFHLKQLIGFTQIRYYCHKNTTGRTFHIMTSPNASGESVVKYLTEDPLVQPPSCGSFVRLPDDNSFLSRNCAKWGKDGNKTECGKWGKSIHSGTFRIYNDPIFWQDKYYVNFKTSMLTCDDSKTARLPLSLGDRWQLFVR